MGGGALSPLFSFILSSVAVLSLCALCSPSPFFLPLYFFLLCFVLLWLFSSLVSFVPLHVRDILFIVETRIFVFIISLSLSCFSSKWRRRRPTKRRRRRTWRWM